jgi:hypothetical protein
MDGGSLPLSNSSPIRPFRLLQARKRACSRCLPPNPMRPGILSGYPLPGARRRSLPTLT